MGGQSVEQAVSDRLQEILQTLDRSGQEIQNGLLWCVRNNCQTIYPDSEHYDPDRVQPSGFQNGRNPEGEILIDIPGICRAYHPHHIVPRFRKALTIPMHQSAYGKKASEFPSAFTIWKKNPTGKTVGFIVQKSGGQLTWLYRLCSSVDQVQDRRLMPSDEVLADNVFTRIMAQLRRVR